MISIRQGLVCAVLCIGVLALQLIWTRLTRGEEKNGREYDMLSCLCIALTVGTFLNCGPWSHYYPLGDSAVFACIGKMMQAGKVPYKEIFDHKGPILYLIEYLGFQVTPHDFTGIWILEVVNILATLLLLRKLCGLFTQRRSSTLLALIMTFLVCGRMVYEGGNFVEEYALPWIALALLIFFRFFRNGTYRAHEIVFLGIGFMTVFLLRANMISAWAALMPVVVVLLIREKRFAEIGQCILLFLAGILTVSVPVVFWLSRQGAVKDFWQCYLVFNTTYSENVALDCRGFLHLTGNYLLLLLPGVLAAVFAVARGRKDKVQWFSLWYFVLSLLMAEMSGRDYPHYLIVQLPALVIGFVCFFDWSGELILHVRKGDSHPIVPLLCCALIFGFVSYRQISTREVRPEEPVVIWLRENTTEDSDVLVLGNSAWVYLASDRQTSNRFVYQTPPVLISEELFGEFLEELRQHPSDVVIDLQMSEMGWTGPVSEQLLQAGYVEHNIENFRVYEKQVA